MKRLISLLLIALLIASFCGCSVKNSSNAATDTTTVITDPPTVDMPDAPDHFVGINETTDKQHIRRIYGNPIAVYESERSEVYLLTFLGVKGRTSVTYMNNSDTVLAVLFNIISSEFNSMEEYEDAVNRTLLHFKSRLSHLIYKDETINGYRNYQWHNVKARYAYSIYHSYTFIKNENGQYDKIPMVIVQYNRYDSYD